MLWVPSDSAKLTSRSKQNREKTKLNRANALSPLALSQDGCLILVVEYFTPTPHRLFYVKGTAKLVTSHNSSEDSDGKGDR